MNFTINAIDGKEFLSVLKEIFKRHDMEINHLENDPIIEHAHKHHPKCVIYLPEFYASKLTEDDMKIINQYLVE